jgi:hypothetical protein
MGCARAQALGLSGLAYCAQFGEQVRETKRKLLQFLIAAKRAGRTVAGYGAPGKRHAAQLLRHHTDFLDYGRPQSLQAREIPGHDFIHAPERLRTHPDYVLILPWNREARDHGPAAYVRGWGGQFVIPIPGCRSSHDVPRDGAAGVFIIEPERGRTIAFFARTWCRDEFAAHGLRLVSAACR